MSRRHCLWLLAVSALLVASGAAQAAIIAYANKADFLAAVSNTATDTFNDLQLGVDVGSLASPLTRTAGPYQYTASATNDFFNAGTTSDTWLSTNSAIDVVTLGNFTGGVQAIGGTFFATDLNGGFLAGETITLVATDIDGSTTLTVFDSTVTSFHGFVSTGLLANLTFASDPNSVNSFPTLNDLVLGTVSAVPEPASYVLFVCGLVLLGVMTRRRQASTCASPRQ